MTEVNFDGECHALSDDYCYIAAQVNEDEPYIDKIKDKQLLKYSEYLVNFNKERALELLAGFLRVECSRGFTSEDYQFIFRSPFLVNALAEYGTLVLKFKRSKEDNLENKNEIKKSQSRCG
jgi:hypothetical protein